MAGLPVHAVAEAPRPVVTSLCRADSRRAAPRSAIALLPFSKLPAPGAGYSRPESGWLREQLAAAHIGHRRLAALQVNGLDGLRGHLAAVGAPGASDDFLAVGCDYRGVFELHANSFR